MDPKKIAEDIINELFPQGDELVENEETLEENEDNDEDDNDGEEGDDSGDQGEQQQGGMAASVAMKSSASAVGASSGGAKGTYDQTGQGNKSWDGSSGQTEFETTGVSAEANRQSVAMKVGVDSAKVQEDVKTLFGADVSEEFLTQAASLYEASLNTNLQEITEHLTEEYNTILAEEVAEIQEAVQTQVNEYLGYVVEEWMKENQLAIETGLRTEIAENFIAGLKNLFAESYIEVPEDKTNVFDEMTDAIEALETRVNEEMHNNLKLREHVSLLEAQAIFGEETKNLKSMDAENIKKIAENLEFSTAADFQSKVKVLVENYTSVKSAAKKPVVSAKTNEAKAIGNAIDNLMNHSDESDEQAEFLSENIKLYSQVLGRTLSE